MRSRMLWIGVLAAGALLIAGYLVLRGTRQPAEQDAPDGRTPYAGSPTTGSPSLPVASIDAAVGAAGFDCVRPTGVAARIDGIDVPLDRLCAKLAVLGAVGKSGVARQQARLVLERMIDATLVTRELTKQRAVVSDEEVVRALRAMPPSGATSSADAVVKEQLRERLELEKLVALGTKVEVTEQDVDAELAAGAPGIDRGQGVRVEAWIARVPPDGDADAQVAAQKRAQTFAQAVKTTSPEAAAKEHGLAPMPPFVLNESGIEPALEQAALAAAKGQWTEAVKTRVGWTVLHVLDRVEGTPLANKALRERVRQALITRQRVAAQQRVLEALRGAAKIEILVDL